MQLGMIGLGRMGANMVERLRRGEIPIVEDGLAERWSDPADGRVTRVSATREGERVAGALQRVRLDHLERALARWSAQDLQQLDALLTRFVTDTSGTPF